MAEYSAAEHVDAAQSLLAIASGRLTDLTEVGEMPEVVTVGQTLHVAQVHASLAQAQATATLTAEVTELRLLLAGLVDSYNDYDGEGRKTGTHGYLRVDMGRTGS